MPGERRNPLHAASEMGASRNRAVQYLKLARISTNGTKITEFCCVVHRREEVLTRRREFPPSRET